MKHNNILITLLGKINKISYSDLAESDLTKRHYLVITIEQLLKIANANNWNLARQNDFVYLYNGKYWEVIDRDRLKHFLTQVALKMGMNEYFAKEYKFQDELYKQFLATAFLPAPEMNKNKVFINLQNGTFGISQKEQKLKKFNSKDFLTYQLPFEYKEGAKAPIFTRFLNDVLPSIEKQKVLAEFLGYVFIKSLKLEKALLLYGEGANGKSVFFDVISAILGKENISNYSLTNLTDSKGYHRANIKNKLVNYASEIGKKLESETFKQLSSCEPIDARLPYGNPFIMEDYARLIFNTNELPIPPEQTNGYFRRYLIIHFDKTIPESKQDKELASKIIDKELPGVFNWILEGLKRILEQRNFTYSKEIEDSLNDYKLNSDTAKLYLKEEQYQKSNDKIQHLKFIYSNYRQFCFEDGYKALGKANFSKRLHSMGYQFGRDSEGKTIFMQKM